MRNRKIQWLAALLALVLLAGLPFAASAVQPKAGDTNLARLDGVVATASNSEAGTSFTADKARDGNTTDKASRWATDANASKPERWLQYDLGNAYTIRSFQI